MTGKETHEDAGEVMKNWQGDKKLTKFLVVDTAGFIKNVPFHEFGEEIITLHDVLSEIRDKPTKQRLKAQPLELKYMEPDGASLQKVMNFAKRTGDYGALSLTDMKVMALTYMLEALHVGTEHLRKNPEIKRTVNAYKPKRESAKLEATLASKVAGFYVPSIKEDHTEEDNGNAESDELDTLNSEETVRVHVKDCDTEVQQRTLEALERDLKIEDDSEYEKGIHLEKEASGDESTEEGTYIDEDTSGYEISEEDLDNDDDGWITPANFTRKKRQIEGASETPVLKNTTVACMTSDFAMQNVLLHMGLQVASPSGQLIRETKTWILRCYGCFFITPKVEKKFCPKCGNKTLKRVSVTLNADGTQQIHISSRLPLSKRGKVFPLPMPKGGKHAVNPWLTSDQQFPQQRLSKTALARNNPMESDFITGNAPFCKNDVTSKSALMGVGKNTNQYWLRKNPNRTTSKTGNRKKKRS